MESFLSALMASPAGLSAAASEWLKVAGIAAGAASTVTSALAAAIGWLVWRRVRKNMDGRYTRLSSCEAMRAELVEQDATFAVDMTALQNSIETIKADGNELKAGMVEINAKLDGFFEMARIVLPPRRGDTDEA